VGTPIHMWLAYPVLVVLAGVAFGFGAFPVGIIFVVALIVLLGLRLGSQAKTRRIGRDTGGASGVPSTTEASYQPQGDPRRSGS
jgi:hypothetical protein